MTYLRIHIALALLALTISANAQKYILEITPKLYYMPNGLGSGIGGDFAFVVSKLVTIGGTSYFEVDGSDIAYGLSVKFTSNRQKLITGYGVFKVLRAHYEEEDANFNYEEVTGIGFSIGAGGMLNVGRHVSLSIEVGHFLGEGISGNVDQFSQDPVWSGFRGLVLEAGVVFRMIRKK